MAAWVSRSTSVAEAIIAMSAARPVNGRTHAASIIEQGAALSCPCFDARYMKFENAEMLVATAFIPYCIRRTR